MTGENHDAEYDPARNSSGCYALAVREIRLEKIRSGLLNPRDGDPEEAEAAAQSRAIRPELSKQHRVSA